MTVFFKSYFLILLSCTVLGLNLSCSWNQDSRPSILVIAVESLGFHEVSCGSNRFLEQDMAGYKAFCEDTVRFTHAFTPSLMSQSSLASVLTGLYPNEHKVFHNGADFLSSEFKTVAEVAVERSYRTAFFSGGAPIWHKSGLGQGFELFEDNLSVDLHRLYRPVHENFEHLLNWLDDDEEDHPYFAVVYLNDLLFPEITTVNDLGEIRERSLESQVREIGESLNSLINSLKNRKLWDNSYVILMGLNGHATRDRLGDMDAFSMFSLSTQVGLFIKPARQKRDKGIEWSQDKNVSLADVGETLFDFLGAGEDPERTRSPESVSLTTAVLRPEAGLPDDRTLWIESDWPVWREYGGKRVAARKGQYLVVFDEEVELYNTLIDRFEVTPVPPTDPIWRTLMPELIEVHKQRGYNYWNGLPDTLVGKLRLSSVLWRANGFSQENVDQLRFLSRIRPWDSELIGWQAYGALDRRDWDWLERLGQQNNNVIWTYVAKRNLSENYAFKARGCARLFLWQPGEFKTPSPQVCEDRLLIEAVEWALEPDSEKANQRFESFWRNYRIAKTDEWIVRHNYANSLIWDSSLSQLEQPLLVDLYLLLPRNRERFEKLKSRLSSKDFRFQLSSPFEF